MSSPHSPSVRRHVVGCDVAIRRGDRLEVHARREMSEWEVRKYGCNGIVFDGTTWVTVSLEQRAKDCVVYGLEPWDRNRHDSTPMRLLYDEDYVEARERKVSGMRIGWWIGIPAGLAAPVLGLLPAFAKGWLEEALGIDAVTVTRASVYLEAGAAALSFTILGIYGFASLVVALRFGPMALFSFVGVLMVLMIVILVLVVDLLFRGASLRGERVTLGFYEGLVRWLIRLPALLRR